LNLGDSRSSGLNKYEIAVSLTKDHSLTDLNEKYILKEQGEKIIKKRVGGILALSRAIGDCSLKLNR